MACKIYVSVMVRFDKEGNMAPIALTWEDGRVFEIDRILEIRRAASLKAGGQGTRYTCRITGQQRYLYYEGPGWFVEGENH